jgi:hypothetical protein
MFEKEITGFSCRLLIISFVSVLRDFHSVLVFASFGEKGTSDAYCRWNCPLLFSLLNDRLLLSKTYARHVYQLLLLD